MASMVLGVIGLMLFFLPILGIPISVLGLALGLIGLLAVFTGARATLRWSLVGIGISAFALLVNIAIVYAPSGYSPSEPMTRPWEPPPGRPFVPPPAPPT
jgi:hypothetical protein